MLAATGADPLVCVKVLAAMEADASVLRRVGLKMLFRIGYSTTDNKTALYQSGGSDAPLTQVAVRARVRGCYPRRPLIINIIIIIICYVTYVIKAAARPVHRSKAGICNTITYRYAMILYYMYVDT